MSITAARRGFGVLVAIAVAALPAISQPLATSAASTGTLFAITASQNLVKVDPSTGAFTVLGSLNTPDSPQSNALASDPATHRLFAVRTTMTFTWPPIVTQELLTIDSGTGNVISKPQFAGRAPQSLAFDTSSGKLLGFDGLAIVSVDAATAATTTLATIATGFGGFIYSLALDTPSHTIYLSQEDVSGSIETNSTRIFSVSTQGGPVSTGPKLARTVRQIAVDSGQLFGITDCCSFDFVAINNTDGSTMTKAPGIPGAIIQFGTATDTATHTVFVDVENQVPGSWMFTDQILSINDQSGVITPSGTLADSVVGLGLAFEPVIAITADSIRADVRSALASGAIDNSGVATALLAQLNAAAAARTSGQCATAANIYHAFINAVTAQSGQHIAAATATTLISEAQFLIAHCP